MRKVRAVVITGCVLAWMAMACTSAETSTAPANPLPTAPPTDIEGALAAWRQAAIDDYVLEVVITECMICGSPLHWSVTVTDGRITHSSPPPGSQPRSAPNVDELLTWIERYGPEGSDATYNEFGVPLEVHLDKAFVSDDQVHYEITFTPT